MYKLYTVIYQNSVSGETIMVISYTGNDGRPEYDADIPKHWKEEYWKPGKLIVFDCEIVK